MIWRYDALFAKTIQNRFDDFEPTNGIWAVELIERLKGH